MTNIMITIWTAIWQTSNILLLLRYQGGKNKSCSHIILSHNETEVSTLYIGCWLYIEMWAMHSKVKAGEHELARVDLGGLKTILKNCLFLKKSMG